jgi:hypothetical protein
MQSKLILIALLLCFLISCNKTKEVKPAQKNYLSKAIYTGEGGTFAYTYDAQNRLKSEKYLRPDGSLIHTINVLKYTTNGSVEEMLKDYNFGANNDETIQNIFDIEGRIIRQNVINSQTLKSKESFTFIYTTGFIRLNFLNSTGALTQYFVFKLSADGKNHTEYKSYNSNNTLTTNYIYSEFQAQKLPYSLLPYGFQLFPSQFNTNLKEVYTGTNTTKTYTCEYNADGYATKITASPKDVTTFDYIKK